MILKTPVGYRLYYKTTGNGTVYTYNLPLKDIVNMKFEEIKDNVNPLEITGWKPEEVKKVVLNT